MNWWAVGHCRKGVSNDTPEVWRFPSIGRHFFAGAFEFQIPATSLSPFWLVLLVLVVTTRTWWVRATTRLVLVGKNGASDEYGWSHEARTLSPAV